MGSPVESFNPLFSNNFKVALPPSNKNTPSGSMNRSALTVNSKWAGLICWKINKDCEISIFLQNLLIPGFCAGQKFPAKRYKIWHILYNKCENQKLFFPFCAMCFIFSPNKWPDLCVLCPHIQTIQGIY